MNKINNDMLQVGTVLRGTYRIDGYLSSGGFGNTYLATNIEFEEQYAIKEFFMRGVSERNGNSTTISVSNADNEATFASQLEKFKKEARRIRKLNNPHIVKVYDLFDENGTSYYVMDYIDGESLAKWQRRTDNPMPEERVLTILPQILDALQTAHSAGIWHLDLKPANIMVDKQGNVKLIDFGASKQQSALGGATATSAISYTNGFAPREQMEQNLNKFGPWTDFYALGATLYTLLTNKKLPLPSDIDDDNTVDKHIALPFPSSVSAKSKKLVLWLMSTNRNNRPQSVEDINTYLYGKDVKGKSSQASNDKDDTLILNSEEKDYSSMSTNELKDLAKKGNDDAQAELSTRYYLNQEPEGTTAKNNQEETLLANDDDTDYTALPINRLHELAEDGDDKAQVELAKRYYLGKDTSKNEKAGFEWFKKAASAGNVEGECELGFRYYFGNGTERNLNKAIYWFRKAAKEGYAVAQNQLGVCYEEGIGVAVNFDKALEWYEQAADQGLEEADNNYDRLEDKMALGTDGAELANAASDAKKSKSHRITGKMVWNGLKIAGGVLVAAIIILGKAAKKVTPKIEHELPKAGYIINKANSSNSTIYNDSMPSDTDPVTAPAQTNTEEVW